MTLNHLPLQLYDHNMVSVLAGKGRSYLPLAYSIGKIPHTTMKDLHSKNPHSKINSSIFHLMQMIPLQSFHL